jgi:hypothetical protein
MAFVHVVPTKTGLSRTIWVSQSERYPYLLVNPHPGRAVHPPPDVLVVGHKDQTPFADVNIGLQANRQLLPPLANQEIDIGHFHDEMVKFGALTEIVNVPRRLPMVV